MNDQIEENINNVKKTVDDHSATLVAISKTKPVEDIKKAYDTGIKDFGENKVQEMVQKQEELPIDIRWHMVGHLQRNKVKYIAPFVYLIHSIDSFKLLKEVNKQAERNNRIIKCLLQIHIAEEDTKFGFSESEVDAIIQNDELSRLKNIKIYGLMGMATFTENKDQIKREFNNLKDLFDKFGKKNNNETIEFKELSMGMSNDYELALDAGSTMVRLGSTIFGSRNYQ